MTSPTKTDNIQASDRPAKVTSVMVEAGMMAFNRHVADDTPLLEAKEEIVREIFLAMDALSSDTR